MKKKYQHILHQVNLEINTTNETKAFEIKNQIDDFLKEELFPNIELLFDESITPEEIRRFESIDLEVQMYSSDHLGVIKDQLISQLHEKIDRVRIEFDRSDTSFRSGTISEKDKVKKITLSTKDQLPDSKDAFLHFLETGQLPWYAIPEILIEFTQPIHFNESLQDKYFLRKLKSLFSSNLNTLKRFIQQFDDEIIGALLIQLSNENNLPSGKLLSQISMQSHTVKELLYLLIIKKLIQSNYQITSEHWHQLQNEIQKEILSKTAIKNLSNQIQEILRFVHFDIRKFKIEGESIDPKLDSGLKDQAPEPNTNSGVKNEEKTNPETEITDKNTEFEPEKSAGSNSVYIQNAGLILAHPFLGELFRRTSYINEAGSLIPETQTLAIHLLHYLSTGQEQEMEYELTFEKFLCGVPLESPINRKVELSDQDKLECNDLLQSLISNWTALKNTSPDSLRQTFFQRNGKLYLQKSPLKLYVERMAFDVLLDQLPWNISMVKLPWMKEILFVEW